ncbi:MAG: hypothetical protein AAF081_10565 [Actinomycetota bacterium]
MRRWTAALVMVFVAGACGGGSDDAGPASSTTTEAVTTTTEAATTTTEAVTTTTEAATTTTEAATTTTAAATTTSTTTTAVPIPASALVDNPDRPWLVGERDALVERSGMNPDAANCIVELFEREGFDMRLLIWTDTSTPAEFFIALGSCGSRLNGGFDLPDSTLLEAEFVGDDPFLDELHAGCGSGDAGACDSLWWTAPIDSEYEAFGDTCGGTVSSDGGGCVERAGAGDVGDSVYLDRLHASCLDGYGGSCDTLGFLLDIGGEYAATGRTCGGRFPASDDNQCSELLRPG